MFETCISLAFASILHSVCINYLSRHWEGQHVVISLDMVQNTSFRGAAKKIACSVFAPLEGRQTYFFSMHPAARVRRVNLESGPCGDSLCKFACVFLVDTRNSELRLRWAIEHSFRRNELEPEKIASLSAQTDATNLPNSRLPVCPKCTVLTPVHEYEELSGVSFFLVGLSALRSLLLHVSGTSSFRVVCCSCDIMVSPEKKMSSQQKKGPCLIISLVT